MPVYTYSCAYCGVTFEAANPTAVYCSNSHRAQASQVRRRATDGALQAELLAFRATTADILSRLASIAADPTELDALRAEAAALVPARLYAATK